MEGFLKLIEKGSALLVAQRIAHRKSEGRPLRINDSNQDKFPELIEAVILEFNHDQGAKDNFLTYLAQITNPSQIKPETQNLCFRSLIETKSLQGLKWFLAVDFDPSSKDRDGANVLEYLAEIASDPASPNHLNIAKMLIGAKKSTENLTRERIGLRIRTKEGKDLEGLEGNLSDLVIFGLEQDIIRLSEFKPLRGDDGRIVQPHSFEETLENIFSNEVRTDNLLRQYNTQSRIKIKKEDLPRALQKQETLEENSVRPFTFDNDASAFSPMHISSSTTLRRRNVATKYSAILPEDASKKQKEDVTTLIPQKEKSGCVIM